MTFTTNIRFIGLEDRSFVPKDSKDGEPVKGYNLNYLDNSETTGRIWITQSPQNIDLITDLKACKFGDELLATFNLSTNNNQLRLQLAAIE